MERFDVVVCGLGAMGSATLYQLAKRGLRVLGIDRYAPPHDLGSSHGETRITRCATGEGLAYVPLALRSHQLWRAIEQETGLDILTSNGVLVLASPGSWARHHGKTHFLETTIEAARTFGIDHEVLTAAEIGARFPQFRLVGDETGYFEPGGGFVRPEAAVAAQLELARRGGAVTRLDETLVDYAQQGDGVTVATNRGMYSAGELVLAVGAWLGEVLGPPCAADFAVTRQVQHWYAAGDALESFQPDCFPVFIWDDRDRAFYGFPAVAGAGDAVKVAGESEVRSATVDEARSDVASAERFELFDTIIRDRLPGLKRDCVRASNCLYTVTPGGDFVIDRHPDHPRVFVVSPCSGHGFKHSAAIGEAVAAQIAGEVPLVDLTPFSFERLAGASMPAPTGVP
jgi:sarcosine oxidase